MPWSRGLEPKLNKTEKSLLSQVLGLVKKNEEVIVGAVATGVVALASDLHVVISHASVAAVLTPLVTSVLVKLNAKLGLVSKLTGK